MRNHGNNDVFKTEELGKPSIQTIQILLFQCFLHPYGGKKECCPGLTCGSLIRGKKQIGFCAPKQIHGWIGQTAEEIVG